MNNIKILNTLLIVSLIFIIIQSYRYYVDLSGISCISLSEPPEYFVLENLTTRIGFLLILPCVLIVFKQYIKRRI
jgi:hypothetical protein